MRPYDTTNGNGEPTIVRRARNAGWCNSSPGEGVAAIDNFGDSGSAARFFYTAKASRHDRNDGLQHLAEKPLLWSSGAQNPGSFQSENTNRAAQNNHPTVKPTDLMRWLCRLITPPGGTILDPFMGSGSTLKAAELEGFSSIGIDLSEEYAEIARRRIASDAPMFAEPVDVVRAQPQAEQAALI